MCSPERAQYTSTGCSPVNDRNHQILALKGRNTLAQGEALCRNRNHQILALKGCNTLAQGEALCRKRKQTIKP